MYGVWKENRKLNSTDETQEGSNKSAVMAPVALPVSGLLTGTAAIRLWFESGLKKELNKYISAYVS